MTTRDGRYPARTLRPEPPGRAIRSSGDATDRLTKLQVRMSHLSHRSTELRRASAQLRAHSREVLARAHEHVRAAGALRRSDARPQGAGRMSKVVVE